MQRLSNIKIPNKRVPKNVNSNINFGMSMNKNHSNPNLLNNRRPVIGSFVENDDRPSTGSSAAKPKKLGFTNTYEQKMKKKERTLSPNTEDRNNGNYDRN